MPKTENLVGRRYGHWIVIEQGEPSNQKTRWLCQCDCGTQRLVHATSLIRGISKSCGRKFEHFRIPSNMLGQGVSAFNVYFKLLKESAQRRNIPFELTREQVIEINSKNCFYCNCPPSQQVIREKKLAGKYVYNGIDRVDNDKGYISENVVPCCKNCNSAKMKLSLNEFRNLIKRIYFNWASK